MVRKNSNLQYLEEKKLHNKFFHNLYEDGSRVTVCLIFDEKNKLVARGSSICSSADLFSKREGRAASLGRAIKALVNKRNSLKTVNRKMSCNGFIRSNEAFEEISRVFKFKSEYKPSVDIIPWNTI